MPHLLALTTSGYQGKHRFDYHPLVPRSALADFDILRIAASGVKSRVGTNHYFFFKFLEQSVKLCVGNICRIGLKATDSPNLFNTTQSFPPTIHREFDLPFLPKRFLSGKRFSLTG